MKKALIILNHNPVDGVFDDLRKMGVEEVHMLKDVDSQLAQEFANVPFSVEEVRSVAEKIARVIDTKLSCNYFSGNESPEYDIVVIAGEPRLVHQIAMYFVYGTELGTAQHTSAVKFFSPYSKRVSIDEPQPDGSVKKVTKFVYEGLAPYWS